MTSQAERPVTPSEAVAWARHWISLHQSELRDAPRADQVETVVNAYAATFSPLRAIDHMNHLPVVRWVAQELIETSD